MNPFAQSYTEAAIWSSIDDEGEPLDRNYSPEDMAPETIARIIADCATFEADNHTLFTEENCLRYGPDCTTPTERAGHDFWLTRNGHGAGFWDGDWKEPAASVLTAAAKKFGELDLYVGDDGKLYF